MNFENILFFLSLVGITARSKRDKILLKFVVDQAGIDYPVWFWHLKLLSFAQLIRGHT